MACLKFRGGGSEFRVSDDTSLSSSIMNSVIDTLYPIGSVYMSMNNTMPAALTTGRTWVAITGEYMLKTITSGDGGTYTGAGNTGSTTLTAAQSGLPSHSHSVTSHTHSVGAHSHGLNSHTHSVSATTGNQSADHTHGVSATTSGVSANHTHTIPAHGHGFTQPNVTGGGVTNGISGGSHYHMVVNANGSQFLRYASVEAGGYGLQVGGGFGDRCIVATGSSVNAWCAGGVDISSDSAVHNHNLPSHSHTVSGGAVKDHAAFTTGTISSDHTHSFSTTSGGVSANHTHSFSTTSGAASGSTANSTAFDTGGATATASSNTAASASEGHSHTAGMPANVAVYMWKRTA